MKLPQRITSWLTQLRGHALVQQSTQRWNNLNQREQRLMTMLAAVLGLAVLYFAVWQPSNNAVSQAQQRLSAQQQQLQWVKQSLAKYQALSEQAESNAEGNQQTVTQRLNAAANALELSIARLQPQGEGTLVTIDEADFTTVIDFIDLLQSQYSLYVSAADVARLDEPGQVRVRQLLVMDAS